jgi:hypothetical protein
MLKVACDAEGSKTTLTVTLAVSAPWRLRSNLAASAAFLATPIEAFISWLCVSARAAGAWFLRAGGGFEAYGRGARRAVKTAKTSVYSATGSSSSAARRFLLAAVAIRPPDCWRNYRLVAAFKSRNRDENRRAEASTRAEPTMLAHSIAFRGEPRLNIL